MLIISQFKDASLDDADGNKVLKEQGINPATYTICDAVKAQSYICLGTYLMTYLFLRKKKPNFVEIGDEESSKRD
jgi:hypothetical protein